MDIIISNSSNKPIYLQIVDQIIDHIVTGRLQTGEPLPSIRALARDLKISVITTKRAYEELERDGYIETIIGRGTFVSGMNKSLLRDRKLNMIERDLSACIDNAKRLKLTKEEFISLINLLWE